MAQILYRAIILHTFGVQVLQGLKSLLGLGIWYWLALHPMLLVLNLVLLAMDSGLGFRV